MTATSSVVAAICQIAEAFGKSLGLAEFEIDRVVRSRDKVHDEWIVYLRRMQCDANVIEEERGTIVVIDAESKVPRLIEGL